MHQYLKFRVLFKPAVIILALAGPALLSHAAMAQSSPATGGAQPSVPTGGGPSGEKPAPAPPEDQRVILPSASGHVNSAAPTMQRSCTPAAPDRPGNASPDGANDPCMVDANPSDKQRTPEMSK